MVLYKIYSQEYRIRYLAHPCSSAVLFQICCLIFTFLPPLFTGYFTSGFYYKELTYTEQPNVTFLNEFDIIIDSPLVFGFSSSDARLNNYFTSNYYSTTLTSNLPRDIDDDGINDQFPITIDVILSSDISNSVLNVWLLFQYTLNQYPLINMTTLGLISLKVPSSLSDSTTVTVYGQLNFQQRIPVLSYLNDSSIQSSIIDFGSSSVVASFDDILDAYWARNFYTTFDQQYVQWSSSSNNGSKSLTINVIVNTGPQVIRYVPNFWKEFRWSWIQYVTGLLPFFYLINKVKEFVFSNRLVRTISKKSH